MKTEEEKEAGRERHRRATEKAKQILKPGDKIRVQRCGPRKVNIIFAGWDGNWIVSKSGGNDYSAGCVDRLNGEPVDFSESNAISPSVGAID